MIKPYFQNDSVTLYHGDCFEVMRELQGPFDAAITDPPYGIGEFKYDVSIDAGSLHAALRTLCKRNAARVFFCNMRLAVQLVNAGSKDFRYDLVWDRIRNSSPADSRRRPLRCHENILVFYSSLPTYNPQMWAGKPYTMSPASRVAGRRWATLGEHAPVSGRTERYPRSVFTISASYESKGFGGHEFGNHPTQKPVAAYEWLIRTYTNEAEVILDPFAGAGTAGVSAMRTGRKAVLIELDEKYCEMAAKRLDAEGKEPLK